MVAVKVVGGPREMIDNGRGALWLSLLLGVCRYLRRCAVYRAGVCVVVAMLGRLPFLLRRISLFSRRRSIHARFGLREEDRLLAREGLEAVVHGGSAVARSVLTGLVAELAEL